MKLELKKFGDLLISRPAGHEAARAVRAYHSPKTETETIDIDFSGVSVVAPSWLDEFVQGLKRDFVNPINFLPSDNQTVIESLKMLSE